MAITLRLTILFPDGSGFKINEDSALKTFTELSRLAAEPLSLDEPTGFQLLNFFCSGSSVRDVASVIISHENANAVFWSCIFFGNLLDQIYKFIDMSYYKFIESL